MKSRNYIITTIVAAAALFSACSLEEDLSPISTPDNYFRSKAECESVVNSCYIPMKNYYNYTFMLATECCTDIAYCPSGTLDARLDISPATPRHGQTVWTQCYLGVQRCNFAINGIEKSKAFIDKDTHEIDEKNSDRIRLLCEAKVLRSFYYYTLTSFFGDVPFYFDDVEDLATLDSLAVLPRMDARKTREACIKDLQEIAPLAPQTRTSDNKEHRLGAATAYMLI
ncbi:MAG: RagB/SusD family nutrient uptake outer membrane protein, partial [Bacteroidales bacterium]|nr:RagB/SusD family nutrient uptake outer membrane protein [Bacteroidales bacterium]